MPASTTCAGRPDSRIRTVRSSSSPSTSVSPARCSKRLRLSVPDGEHHRARVDGGDPAHRHEDPAAGDHLDDQAQDPRRGGADAQRDDDVADLADAVAVGVEDRQPGEPGDVRPARRGHGREATVGAVSPRMSWTTRSSTCSRPRAFAGNPLAVVFDADGLTTEQCQALAFEFHLSETSFLCAPTEPGRRLPGADLHAVRRAALRRAPERRGGAHAGPHRPAGRRARCARSAASASWTWRSTTTARR